MRLKINEFTKEKCDQYTELNEDFSNSEAEEEAAPAEEVAATEAPAEEAAADEAEEEAKD